MSFNPNNERRIYDALLTCDLAALSSNTPVCEAMRSGETSSTQATTATHRSAMPPNSRAIQTSAPAPAIERADRRAARRLRHAALRRKRRERHNGHKA
jgi:hypothetical protein